MLEIISMMFRSWDGIGCFVIFTSLTGFFTWRLFQEAVYTVEIWLGIRK